MIKIENVNLIYDIGKETETYALKNIDLNIRENKFYGILGPSGSGKSSLLYILSGLKKPSSGKALYNGDDLNKIKNKELSIIRSNDFGFVFQRHFLLDYLTSLQNVLVPLNSNRNEDINRAMSLLKDLGLEKEMNKMPFQMSGGQRQRVAIARALINKPKVIFADEITASLDHKNAFEVMKILKKYKKETTIIVVTHDESILEGVDEIINIWDGSIIEDKKKLVNSCSK
ncbi:ABC transporter ATP-binding protein [Clostridium estertheticum]|uniref:ABC transporter ATP-binding protein n=1 Tax=Clostridium estertheticum TaxID=238834 RepID=UPI0013E906D4|nr:ABC transporter ATP-binding protein [Clostridium estertheticum]MBZ9685596.1 ABC transporter ATP-binding protein [Clostridium estertheticum]